VNGNSGTGTPDITSAKPEAGSTHTGLTWQHFVFALRGGEGLNGIEDEGAARAFHLLLACVMVWIVILLVVVAPFFAARKMGGVIFAAACGAVTLEALRLVRKHRVRAASRFFLLTLWCLAETFCFLSGGIRSFAYSMVVLLIVNAGWLLGKSTAIGLTAATLLISFVEAVLEHAGHPLPLYFPGPPIARWAVFAGALLFALGPTLAILASLQQRVTAVRESEERFRSLSNLALEGVMIHQQGAILDANLAFAQLFGYQRPEELIGRNGPEFMLVPESRMRVRQRMERKEEGLLEVTGVRKDGTTFEAETDSRPVRYRGREARLVSCRDVTQRKRALEEKTKLQAQLLQAQKMESIGRMAGGLAHDFNNLLTIINGYSQFEIARVRVDDPIRATLGEIRKAGERAAVLTRQLLAFSRKQILQPRMLDLNRVVQEMQPMLERLVGEAVQVQVALHAESGAVHADPNQLEQVIMNLAVNARDAMPDGGTLGIETALVDRDESFAQSHAEAHAGRYVMLAVSDNGAGMDEEMRQHIFEPFFTTKQVGKGTGLGLSMVQGIVAQSGGYIDLFSEPGQGTTFKIYLPALNEVAASFAMPAPVAAVGGKETVLVVEDQAEVREYTVKVLQEYGYRVLDAADANEALRCCERERDPIHLVLTDVVMPNVSGRELANRLQKLRPGIKVLFMSGYSGDVIRDHGMQDDLIEKPFSHQDLAGRIRLLLDQPGARIVVADDEAAVRGFLTAVLQQGGYEVSEAANGQEALEQARAGQIDLVITDIVMPEQEGIETIRALRRDAPGIGIIAISGAFEGRFLKLAQMLGANAVLSKPVNAELLLAKVAEVLKSRR
jgi:PAS domain S-box-containing protein